MLYYYLDSLIQVSGAVSSVIMVVGPLIILGILRKMEGGR